MEQSTLYSNIDQASDALERLMVNSIASLERNLEMETDPMKISYITSKIIESYDKLQKIKQQMNTETKKEATGVFDKVMQQLSATPRLADKCTRHAQLKQMFKQAEDFKLKEEDNEQNN